MVRCIKLGFEVHVFETISHNNYNFYIIYILNYCSFYNDYNTTITSTHYVTSNIGQVGYKHIQWERKSVISSMYSMSAYLYNLIETTTKTKINRTTCIPFQVRVSISFIG